MHPYPFPPPYTDVHPLQKQKKKKLLITNFSCTGKHLPLALPVSIGSVNLLRLPGVQPGPLPKHDCDAGKAGLPAKQILQREMPSSQSGHCEDYKGGL